MATTEFIRAKSFSAALSMRRIRNECAKFMTGNRNQIGFWEQFRWWRKLEKVESPFVAYLLKEGGRAIGYGLLKYSEGRVWVSGGISASARGRKLGDLLFRALTSEAFFLFEGEEVWLEVWEWNTRALRLYQKLGYVERAKKGNILRMSVTRKRWKSYSVLQ